MLYNTQYLDAVFGIHFIIYATRKCYAFTLAFSTYKNSISFEEYKHGLGHGHCEFDKKSFYFN